MKKNEEKNVRFSISLPENLLEIVDQEAKVNRWSRTTLINFIIETYFEIPKRENV